MENTTITLSIEYFNILSTTVMGLFAIYGAITLFFKNSNLNIFRGRVFIQAYCAAALLAFVLEATVFNTGHHLKYFADGEVHVTGVSPQDSTIILTSDTTVTAHIKIEKIDKSPVHPLSRVPVTKDFEHEDRVEYVAVGMTFKNLNRRITSVHIAPVFSGDKLESLPLLIGFTDELGSSMRIETLYKGFSRDNYITTQFMGKVSDMMLASPSHDLLGTVSQVSLNKQIPLYFSGLRLFIVSCLFFLVIVFSRRQLRAEAARFLFEYKFDPANKKQNIVYAFTVVLLLVFACICAFTSTDEFWQEYLPDRQYSIFLVDALISGRAYLDHGQPEILLAAERPYDLDWLKKNGYRNGEQYMGDWAYRDGKFYCYFGIVPAVLLFVPYKLITGDYLSNNAGIFVFMAISIILLAILWRFFARKYMSNATFAFYLLSFLALFFASALFVPLRFTRFYSIVSAGGFMFAVAGILLLLKSVEHGKANLLKLFFACLCLALTVGCRPNLLMVSLLVPVVLWRHRSFKLALFIMIPYIMVAIPLCYYNYIRFGSIFDFGFYYNMTNLNSAAYKLLNPMGKVYNTFVSSFTYLFNLNKYTITFPFIDTSSVMTFTAVIPRFYDRGVGMINFPIVFCLLFFFKSLFAKGKPRPQTFYLSSSFLLIAAALIFANSWIVGHSGRYMIDFAFFIILPSIFCAYHWCNGGSGQVCYYVSRRNLKVTYALLTVSILVGLFLFATVVSNDPTPGNPVLFRYLQYSLGFIH